MSMTNCKTCDKEISKNAGSCPHCGERDPANKATKLSIGCGALIVVIVVMIALIVLIPEEASVEPTEAEIAECRSDLNCWGEKNNFEAKLACREEIEKTANFEHEWLDGFSGGLFSRYVWFDVEAGTVMYVGDKLKMQNGFGAWSNMVYGCVFNPATTDVVELTIREGKLD